MNDYVCSRGHVLRTMACLACDVREEMRETAWIAEMIREIDIPCKSCKKTAAVTAEERFRGRWTCYSCGLSNRYVKTPS